jgi:hypothetical protein
MTASVGESYRSSIAGRPDIDVADLDVELEARLDLPDISGLETIYRIGRETLELRTSEGRELRITAKQDLKTGEYRAEYERRTTVKNCDGSTCHVWTSTVIYGPMISAEIETCLRRALEDVTKLHVF